MKQVTVIALQPMEWGGQSYVQGQALTVPLLDAIALAKKHRITLTKRRGVKMAPVPEPAPEPVPEPIPEPVVEKPKRRKYQRQDVQPAETAVLVPDEPVSTFQSETPEPSE